MNKIETQSYPKVGAWRILLDGFQEEPGRAIEEVLGAAAVMASVFGLLFLDRILTWLAGALG